MVRMCGVPASCSLGISAEAGITALARTRATRYPARAIATVTATVVSSFALFTPTIHALLVISAGDLGPDRPASTMLGIGAPSGDTLRFRRTRPPAAATVRGVVRLIDAGAAALATSRF